MSHTICNTICISFKVHAYFSVWFITANWNFDPTSNQLTNVTYEGRTRKYSSEKNQKDFEGDYKEFDMQCKRKSDDITCRNCNTYPLGEESAGSVMRHHKYDISYII